MLKDSSWLGIDKMQIHEQKTKYKKQCSHRFCRLLMNLHRNLLLHINGQEAVQMVQPIAPEVCTIPRRDADTSNYVVFSPPPRGLTRISEQPEDGQDKSKMISDPPPSWPELESRLREIFWISFGMSPTYRSALDVFLSRFLEIAGEFQRVEFLPPPNFFCSIWQAGKENFPHGAFVFF